MFEYFKNNPIIVFIFAFIITILFLIIIPVLFSLIKKVIDKHNYKEKEFDKHLNKVEAKIYELLYSKIKMSKNDLMTYFNLNIDDFNKYLEDMINKNIIFLNEENKYELKKNE